MSDYHHPAHISDKDRARAGDKKQCGRRHDVDGIRMSEPQISKFLKMSQGYINTKLKIELAQKFVDRNRIGTETAGEFLKRMDKAKR